MALQMKRALPPEMQEPHLLVEMRVGLTYGELDELPADLVERVLLYRAVRDAIEFGTELIL